MKKPRKVLKNARIRKSTANLATPAEERTSRKRSAKPSKLGSSPARESYGTTSSAREVGYQHIYEREHYWASKAALLWVQAAEEIWGLKRTTRTVLTKLPARFDLSHPTSSRGSC